MENPNGKINIHSLRQALFKMRLTKRQVEITILVLKGLTSKEIANQLSLKEETIKWHLTTIYKVTRCGGREHLKYAFDPYVNPTKYGYGENLK